MFGLARGVLRSVTSALIEATWKRHDVRVLYYHRVDKSAHRSNVHPDAFGAQMQYLADMHYQVIHLAKLYQYLEDRSTIPNRTIVLTFDDGFEDNYTTAFPVLRSFGFPAIIFLTAGFIGRDILPVQSDAPMAGRPLSWKQILEMSQKGIDFGAHTLTHPRLSTLSPGDLEEEVIRSKLLIEDKLNRAIEFFCYPKGDLNLRVKAVVKDAGFRGACGVHPGYVSLRSDHFDLPRTYIGCDDSLSDFRKKLHGAYDMMHAGSQWWKRKIS